MGEAIANMWANLDVNQYLPGAIGWATNILLAVLILIVGYWIAGRVSKGVHALGQKYEQLDDTLFKFLGNIVRWIILAFVFIAVLNRFGVETTSIVRSWVRRVWRSVWRFRGRCPTWPQA